MKKSTLVIAAMIAVLSLTACTDSGNVSSTDKEQSSVSSGDTVQSSTEESSADSASDNTDSNSDSGEAPLQNDGMTESSALDSIAGLVDNYDRLYNIYIRCGAVTEDYNYGALPEDEQGFRYAPVSEYASIAEMKADTEKYVTVSFAEKEFYSVAMNEDLPYYKETDGKLYVIADAVSGGENTWDKTSAKVLSCDNDSAVVNVEYQDNYGGEKRAEFTLITDGGSVKIDKVVLDLSR